MNGTATALLRRVRLVIADAAADRVELSLDGWPLLVVDGDAGSVGVNDLGSSRLYAHVARLPPTAGNIAVRTDAVGGELFMLLGDVAAVFVTLDPTRATHAEVKVVESATGRLLLDREVRYRQVPAERRSPSPVRIDTRR